MDGYSDLRLRVEREAGSPDGGGEGGYRVFATGPAGKATGSFRLPFREFELENFVLRLAKSPATVRRLETPQRQLVADFGGRLFDSFFTAGVRDLYRDSCTLTQGEGKGLRITLALNEVPELMHVPWEYLYDDPNFLAISTWTPVVRYVDLPRGRKPLPVTLPLRILAMVSSPTDAPTLDVAHEKANLEQALKPLVDRQAVEVVWLETATLRALQDALREGPFHVFHYIGHGGYDVRADDGVLLLESDTSTGRPVPGADLGTMLHDHASLRLAVLNACEGARTSSTDPFSGVATSLVQREIPAVIAMQFEITDRAAIVFAAGFYSAVADGYPVDAALAEARKSIFADDNDVEWGAPVLFMRVPDGRIFDLPQTDALPRGPEGEPPADAGGDATPGGLRLPGGRSRWVLAAALVVAAALAAVIGVVVLGGGDGGGGPNKGKAATLSWSREVPDAFVGDGNQELAGVADTTDGDAVAAGFESANGKTFPRLWNLESSEWSRSLSFPDRGLFSGIAVNKKGIIVAVGRTAPVDNPKEASQDALAVTLTEKAGVTPCGPACGDGVAGGGSRGQSMWAVVARRRGGFSAVGYDYDPGNASFDAAAWWSRNGKGWKRAPNDHAAFGGPKDQVMRGITETSTGLLVGVGWNGHSAAVWTSTDGLKWIPLSLDPFHVVVSSTTVHLNAVAQVGARLYAVGAVGDKQGNNNHPRIYVSSDLNGRTWRRLNFPAASAVGEAMLGVMPLGDDALVVGYGHRDGHQVAKAWRASPDDTVVPLDDDAFRGDGDFEMNSVTPLPGGLALAVGDGPPRESGDPGQDGAAWLAQLEQQ